MRTEDDEENKAIRDSPVSPVGRDGLWYLLAEITLRRLFNQVSHLIY